MIKALENLLAKHENVKTVWRSGYIDDERNVLFSQFIEEVKDSKFNGQDVKYVWFTRYEVSA